MVGKIVVSEFVSLDGVMEAPAGEPGYRHNGWVMKFPDPVQFGYKLKELLEHDALLLGRRTFEGFAAAWPARDGEVADRINRMPKYVVSTTLKQAEWNNSTVLQGDAVAAVTKLKQELDGDILIAGSRTLVNTLKQHDLIDEYRLMFFPIVLGSGMRLFDDTVDATTLTLADLQQFDSGTVVLTYRPTSAAGEAGS